MTIPTVTRRKTPPAQISARVAQIVAAIEQNSLRTRPCRPARRPCHARPGARRRENPSRWRWPRHGRSKPREAIELCLEATRAGLLNLRWDLFVPALPGRQGQGRQPRRVADGALIAAPAISITAANSRRTSKLSFSAGARQIGWVEHGEYCLFRTHGGRRISWCTSRCRRTPAAVIAAHLEPGPYRLRTLEAGPEADIDYAGGGFSNLRAEHG